ncbi:hypothetical protein GNIT_2251 [Glaciecola nitratireducens FR1064]|uniref:Uncharacterized protein n=1 Tax=Glaciecola nitratireducens (strain JCM 12485 / KCTC 12276 / FR1064) TaxID=1085623 RepID=G4QKP9_GLANF|nr:hypothetical protein GNIT_2251 [Glaciecola nitratireducens FR1064]
MTGFVEIQDVHKLSTLRRLLIREDELKKPFNQIAISLAL